jgi:hypothetical protein
MPTFPPSGSTTKYAFPYPLETDIPDVATFGQELAAGVETTVDSVAKISRQAAGSLLTPGILSGALATTQHSAPNMTVNVAAGGAWVAGTISVPQQGNYFYYNPGTVNLSIANNVSGNPRLDAVCLTVKDSDFSGSVDNPGLLQVITGTPSGSPVLPTLPANSLLLSQISVASGAGSIVTGNIANVAPLASPLGGVRGNPCARMDMSSLQGSITQNTWTQVIHLASTFAVGITPGSNQLTVVTAGKYRVHADLAAPLMSSTADAAVIAIYINGTIAKSERDASDSGGVATPQISTLFNLAAGDVVTLWFNQPNAPLGAEVSTAELSMEMVSA